MNHHIGIVSSIVCGCSDMVEGADSKLNLATLSQHTIE